MPVDIFTKDQFEAALPVNKNTGAVLWTAMGMQLGEYTYRIAVNPVCSIEIRSSIHSNGRSAQTGKDSIRAWLVDAEGKPVGSKVQSYVTRVSGWEQRLVDMLRKLYVMGQHVVMCNTCSTLVGIYKVKKDGENKGKLFVKCKCSSSFKWVE